MHLAFLGVCPDTRDLAAAAASMGHRLTWYTDDEERSSAAAIDDLRTDVAFQPQDRWESLLDSPSVDGVVLAAASAGWSDLRADQWRRLTQAGARIMLVHPVVPSLLVYLEVDMLAGESGAVLVPYWPDAHCDGAASLAGFSAGPNYGVGRPRFEQISLRRFLEDRSPENVTKWFARDAALLDLVVGPFSDIAAIGPDVSHAAYASLAVHLHGPQGVPVRWEVARPLAGEQAELIAEGGDEHLRVPLEVHAVRDAAGVRVESLAGLAEFSKVIGTPSLLLESWRRAVRAMELADSIEISLRRGRRIDVYYRQLTEETSYKGTMSAIGCGLLLLAPVVLLVAGIINAVFGWRLTKFWYLPVLVIFVGFLLVQLFARMMARRPATDTVASARQSGEPE